MTALLAPGSLPRTIDDGTRKYVWGLDLAYNVAGSPLEVYHADRLGSVRLLTDETGSVTDTYRYDESGIPTASSGSSDQPFRFTAEPTDATGLSYLRARYYDPAQGRFMARDAWAGNPKECQTLNRYAYALNDPTTRIDPSGLKSQVLDQGGSCRLTPEQRARHAAAGLTLVGGGATLSGLAAVGLSGVVVDPEELGPLELFESGEALAQVGSLGAAGLGFISWGGQIIWTAITSDQC